MRSYGRIVEQLPPNCRVWTYFIWGTKAARFFVQYMRLWYTTFILKTIENDNFVYEVVTGGHAVA
jgi:hypothetical protein